MKFITTLVAAVIYVLQATIQDYRIREREYSTPLSTMPGNVQALADEMFEEATRDKQLSADQAQQIEAGIWKMLGEGAVLQRNHELKKTREKISYLGQLLSWFMKAKGLSYAQIEEKYRNDFTDSEKELHRTIVESASRSNQDLVGKLWKAISKKFWGAQAKL
ncbi:hypothetical protein MO867_09505 [Microbulbifer sp. OS29]|uniref:Uncharacterized protein n=1 Tax=Microbulbifer okhotskensis TaxID=2926617 RepID=A0A9X2J4W8_9GAMM|nr:hypothetical protein [Microbulbifer okhotskensis]MCO1334573.1 hypothetical protein [Microbulbifer okhotskensis]